jgi:branched-chain amino acid aminotransferase
VSDGEGVVTFATEAGGARRVGRHATLAAASAALPDGAYTTFRTYGGRRVVRLESHLRRLEESVALKGGSGTIARGEARAAVAAALDATRHAESRLRLTFAPPRLFLAVEPFAPLPAAAYERGVACVTVDVRRENPHAKDTRFIATALDAYRTLPPGAEEGLIVGEDDAVLEGLSSNFFAVKDGVLRTEGERVLFGVTRSLVLEVASSVLAVDERPVRRSALPAIDEAFVTSVSREVLPVVSIDGLPVGDGRVGRLTRRVMEGFAALVAREGEPL